MKILPLLGLAALVAAAADRPEIPLWAGGAPGSEGITAQEKVEQPNAEHTYIKVWSIHNPTITVSLPPAGKATGAAMIVAPGGGHRMLAMHEGYDVAEWLNSQGVAAFVLKYRLAREEGSPYKTDVHPVQDAQRAFRLIRSRAAEWGVDPARVGIMGFSAGGEVALRASLGFDTGNASSSDPIERQSARPDFAVLIYPGVRGVPLDKIPANAPPVFLVCTSDDKSPAERVPHIYLAWFQAGIPAEMHVYAQGGHGYGIRQRPLPVSSWNARLAEWLADQGWLKRT